MQFIGLDVRKNFHGITEQFPKPLGVTVQLEGLFPVPEKFYFKKCVMMIQGPE